MRRNKETKNDKQLYNKFYSYSTSKKRQITKASYNANHGIKGKNEPRSQQFFLLTALHIP